MGTMASQITSLTIVFLTVYSDADQRKEPKLRVTGLFAGKSPVTGEFPAQIASNAENFPIWWRHHAQPTRKYVFYKSNLQTVSHRTVQRQHYIDGLVQDCCISSALAMEILQACTKPSICDLTLAEGKNDMSFPITERI